jgi:L-aspartate oxidase
LEHFDERFPTIAASVRAIGLDPEKEWLPIAPAAHYLSGGLLVDLDGATELPGLWACGETSCSGVHGANRLASNSLLEGMVFAPRVVNAIEQGKDAPSATGALGGKTITLRDVERPASAPDLVDSDAAAVRDRLQRTMTAGAGVVRTAGSLELAHGALELSRGDSPADHEVRNLVTLADALIRSALTRTESRGNHWRSDHPERDGAWRLRLVHRGA